MSARKKLRVTPQVRALLGELDAAFEKFHATVGSLSTCDDHSEAVDLGMQKRRLESQIVGIAWRINRHSRGEGDYQA